MSAPKADALPLGDTPIFSARYMYDKFFNNASIFFIYFIRIIGKANNIAIIPNPS